MDLPRLTDPKLFKTNSVTPTVNLVTRAVNLVTPANSVSYSKKNVSWYVNIGLLIGFVIFSIFFLLNCKSGLFKTIDIDPVPFNLATF